MIEENNPKVSKHQSTDNGALASQALEVIKEDPSITQNELAEKLNVTRRIAQRATDELKSHDQIVRVGGKRYGHWEIKG